MEQRKELQGGREGVIYQLGDKVYRPSTQWSESLHMLLNHVKRMGFDAAPVPFGINSEGYDVLSYLVGDVYNYPLSGAVATDQAISSAGRLLRQYHDATVALTQHESLEGMCWMLPGREPYEVICHGDYAPYNAVLTADTVTGIIDFDTAHPGPRIWDVAYAVYCWAPFKTHENDALGNIDEQSKRAKLFCDSYGLQMEVRSQLIDVMVSRLSALIDFMLKEARKGNDAFINHINDGHHLSYAADIEYITSNERLIISRVCQPS